MYFYSPILVANQGLQNEANFLLSYNRQVMRLLYLPMYVYTHHIHKY